MYLLVGDCHVTEKELPDCQNLANYIYEIISYKYCTPIFLGDLYDSHNIIRAEVQKFWVDFFDKLNNINIKPIVITGNHDKPTDSNSEANALLGHKHQVDLITFCNTNIIKNTLILPYFSNHEAFIEICNKFAHLENLICHQTFTGAKFENGFYAKDGIDPSLLPQKRIFSGHIHLTSSFGKVFYTGAPRWRTLSDAIQKERWLYLVDENLNLIEKFPTSKKCSVIEHFSIKDNLLDIQIDPKNRYFLDIYGNKLFIEQAVTKYANIGKIRIFEEQKESATKLNESDPLNISMKKWISQYTPQYITKDEFDLKIKTDDFIKNYL